ncbi:MAG TPA: MBL fold metallo-hydrolase, partial [Spartobacteria bacterium]|nr:MBL fold metallo-hydrolase [Spartobacteria bacterium]
SDSELAEKSGVSREKINDVRSGKIDNEAIERIAPVLKLNAKALADLAKGEWKPDKLENFDGLAQFTT